MDKRMGKKKVIIIIGCMFFVLLCGCDIQKSNSNNTTTGTSQNTGEPTDAAGEVRSEQGMNADEDTLTDHMKKEEPAERQSDADTAGEYVTTDENGETIILQPQSPKNLSESKQEETVNGEKNVNKKKRKNQKMLKNRNRNSQKRLKRQKKKIRNHQTRMVKRNRKNLNYRLSQEGGNRCQVHLQF